MSRSGVGTPPERGTIASAPLGRRSTLVARDGIVYEGCTQWRTGDWFCDYKTRRQVSREQYESKGHVARTFWRWKDYIKSQASCAGAISGLWSGLKGKGLLFFLDECNNGPL